MMKKRGSKECDTPEHLMPERHEEMERGGKGKRSPAKKAPPRRTARGR